MSDVHAALLEY